MDFLTNSGPTLAARGERIGRIERAHRLRLGAANGVAVDQSLTESPTVGVAVSQRRAAALDDAGGRRAGHPVTPRLVAL
ncbi:MAG: hypothetical protein NVSMB48_14940 [Marmoricola sp.]